MTMPKPPNPIRPLLALAALAAARARRLRLRHEHAPTTQRGRVLFIQKCGICHAMAEAGTTAQIGPDLDDAFAAARAAGEGGDNDRRRRQGAGRVPAAEQRQPGGLDAGRHRQRPGPRGRRRLRRHVRRRARRGAARRCRAAPAPRSSPTTAAAAATRSPRRTRAASPGPNLDEVLPGQSAAMIDESIVDPNADDRQGLPGQRDAAELRRNADAEGTRRAGPVPDRNRPAGERLEEEPRAAEPRAAAGGRWHHPRRCAETASSISPQRYAKVTLVALAALALIVLTGAGVRLTGSGLGCPDWPKCYGGTVPPLDTHAVIEYGNRLLTGFVGLAVIAASVARLVPPALPLAPGPVRRAAAARRDRPGDPRRAGRQVPPRARAW